MSRLERLLADLFQRKVGELDAFTAEPPDPILRRVRRRQAVAVVAAIAVLGGVTVGSVAGSQALIRQAKPAVHPSPSPHRGGSIVVGTREYPECTNPITACASATGTWWTVLEHVMPRAMELDAKGNFVPSSMLTGAPGVSQDKNGRLQITYVLNPAARWADGTSITSADFDFTWRAIMNTSGAYTVARYDLIAGVDTSSPKTVVVELKSAYAGWRSLFGGEAGGLLEKAAFPAYAIDLTPDLSNEMQSDIPFSGGPWMLKSFGPAKTVLVRNDHYYGNVPHLDQVTILPLSEAAPVAGLLREGTIEAFPWPPTEDFIGQFSADKDIHAAAGAGLGFEALWFNHASPPLDDPGVRAALMYAIDRQAVVDQIISRFGGTAGVLNCGFVAVPDLGPWCQITPFQEFTYDPARSLELLESAGYDCSTLPCNRNGKKLVIEYSTVSTNELRLQVQQLLVQRARPAGFELRARNYESGTLFGDVGPKGQFAIAQYAEPVGPDPSITGLLACENVESNRRAGSNWIHWCERSATELMHRSDAEMYTAGRLRLLQKIYALEVKDHLSLPLYVLPEMAAWRTDKIAGPIGAFNGSHYGLFFNMNEWYKVDR